MWAKHTNKKGFTIVELLIVIVVIGILAAITITAFNGVQQRANNTRRIAAAKDWQKLITAYTAQNGAYPAASLNNHTCLGTGYPTDLDVNPDEDCLGTGNVKHPVASINTAYRTISSLPNFPGDKLVSTAGIGTTAGISLRSIDPLDPATPQEKLTYPFLYYWLHGVNQDCVLRPVAGVVSGGYTATTAINTLSNEGGLTRCMILLPDPTAL